MHENEFTMRSYHYLSIKFSLLPIKLSLFLIVQLFLTLLYAQSPYSMDSLAIQGDQKATKQSLKTDFTQSSIFDQPYQFTTPGTMRGEEQEAPFISQIIALINQARTKIDICVYEFNYQPMIDAVLSAKNRGVQVRFVGDGDEVGTSGYLALQNQQIPMSLRPVSSYIMHNKFMVIDDEIVVSGSMNFSSTDTMKNNNNMIFIRHAGLASQYTTEFNQMFSGVFGTRKIANPSFMPTLTATGSMQAYFGPKENLLNVVLNHLQGVPKRVYFMIFSFTHPSISARLLELKALGTEIIGIFDESQANNAYSQDEVLALAGVPIFFDGNENTMGFSGGKLHHKVMIIEYEQEKIAINGSYNWSKAATLNNDEHVVVSKGNLAFTQFAKEFCRRWDEAVLHPSSIPYQQDPPLCVELRTPPLIKLKIISALVDPIGKDLGEEYVVVKNVGNVPIDLSNWRFGDLMSDFRHVFAPGSFLNVNAELKIYDRGIHADGINSSSGTLSLNNTGDSIRIFNQLNVEVDRWDYLESQIREGVLLVR